MLSKIEHTSSIMSSLHRVKQVQVPDLRLQLRCCVHAATTSWRLSDADVVLSQECPPLLDCWGAGMTAETDKPQGLITHVQSVWTVTVNSVLMASSHVLNWLLK